MKLAEYKLDYWDGESIKESITIRDITVVLLRLTQPIRNSEPQRNLIATDRLSNILWIADLPDNESQCYGTLELKENKIYGYAGSELCEIDDKTGKILSKQFLPWY